MRALAGGIVYGVIAGVGLVVYTVLLRLAGPRIGPEGLLLPTIAIAAAVAAAWTVSAAIERRSVVAFGLSTVNAASLLLTGAVFAIFIVCAFIELLVSRHNLFIFRRLLDVKAALSSGVILLAVCALKAFAIEAFYHGYLFATLVRGIGVRTASILVGMVFAFVNVVSPSVTASAILTLALAGFALALLVRRTGSIWCGVGFLAAWNWTQSFVFGNPRDPIVDGHLFDALPFGDPLLSGGSFGIVASVLMLPVALLVAGAVVAFYASSRETGDVTVRTRPVP